MLSIVPLLNGGGLFETGAGGSAPKHVQQLVKENYLRWDSLGEFLALAVSFEHLAERDRQRCGPRSWPTRSTQRPGSCSRTASRRRAASARSTTAAATSTSRCTGRRHSPRRPTTPTWRQQFAPIAAELSANEQTIVDELLGVQGQPADIGGYYTPDAAKASAVMRPSPTFNAAIDAI